MKYDNKQMKFSTSPAGSSKSKVSKGTSRYYVYRNGIIRVKFNDGTIHFRLNKNLCLLPYVPEPEIERTKDKDSFDYNGKTIAFSKAMDWDSKYQKFAYGKRPFDFLLDEEGTSLGKEHVGDKITQDFGAKVRKSRFKDWKPVSKKKLDAYIRARYGSSDATLAQENDADLLEIENIIDRIT